MTAGSMENQCLKTSNSLLLAILTESVSIDYFALIDCSLYRHSEKMIERLENAGLGFFVRATETQQKLGIEIFDMIIHNYYYDMLSF